MRGTARHGHRPRPRRKKTRDGERCGWEGYLDRIRLPVSVVAAIGGGFAWEHVRIKAAIDDGSLSAAVSVTHRGRRRTATGVTFGLEPVTAEGSPS